MSHIEPLDARRLLSVSLAHHRLSIAGTAAANVIALSLVLGGKALRVSVDGAVRRFSAASVGTISIDAGGGNDRIAFTDAYGGFAGATTLLGGDGDDTIIGSTGPDEISGGAGKDSLAGNAGNDAIRGNGGRDRIDGGAGNDNVSGNAGVDTVRGGSGRDRFHDVDATTERVDQTSKDILLADGGAALAWTAINDFTYQLQNVDLVALGKTKFDMVVMDADNDDGEPWTRDQIAALQHSAGGEKRVLSYLSIGEAESYRDYWQAAWDANNDGTPDAGAPTWLATVNPNWSGNYAVKYWDATWQAIILKEVDRRAAQGFDGLYLDIVDAFETWGPDGNNQRPTAERDMVDFVKKIAAEARKVSGNASFAIVPQNGEALGHYADYLATITALGHEDVFFDDETKKSATDVKSLVADLDLFKNAGKPVFVTDYATKQANIDAVYAAAAAHGYIANDTDRDLDRLTINAGHEPD